MKVIQVPIDDELLRAVNRRAKTLRSTRASLIRTACQEYLRRLEEAELDRRYVEGYRRTPEQGQIGRTGATLASRVWPREKWDEAW